MKKKNLDRLFDIFLGEEVIVMVDKDFEQITQTKSTLETIKSYFNYSGYLVDTDDDFIYLGHTADTISQVVRKDTIFHLQLAEEDTDFLQEVARPENESGFN